MVGEADKTEPEPVFCLVTLGSLTDYSFQLVHGHKESVLRLWWYGYLLSDVKLRREVFQVLPYLLE